MQQLGDWLVKYATVIGAFGTLLSALFTWRTAQASRAAAKTTKQIAERQTGIGAVQDLAKDYAGKEMYDALKCFGDFVKEDDCHKTNFRGIACLFNKNDFQLTENDLNNEYIKLAIKTLNDKTLKDKNGGDVESARRRIHHFYKSVWRLSELGALEGRSLALLTIETTGWALWRDSILPVTWAKALDSIPPVTWAKALDRQKKEKEFLLPAWGRELIKRVDC